MSFLDRLFGSSLDPLQKQAEELVSVARINATNIFVPLLSRYSVLRDANVENWDFIVTVAGVFIAASVLNNMLDGNAREENLMGFVAERVESWNPDGVRAFEDCKELYEREYDRLELTGHESRYLASDAVGKWIVWNVLNKCPESQEEIMLVRAVGVMVTHFFVDYWRR
jgi:hypothetical protein